MLLSEAIPIGAEKRPMCQDEYFKVAGGQVCSCVLGAIAEALLDIPVPVATEANEDGEFGWLAYVSEALDECEELDSILYEGCIDFDAPGMCWHPLHLWEVITGMNDSGKFTREEIADWLESCGL